MAFPLALPASAWPSDWMPQLGQWFKKVEADNATWTGRQLCVMSEMVSSTTGLHTLTKMAVAIAQIFTPYRFIDGSVHTLATIHSFFKAVDIVPDLNYWFGGCTSCAQQARDYLTSTANALFTVSDAACTINFANFLGVVNSSNIATTLGSLSIYGVEPLALLTNLALGNFILTTAVAGFSITTYQAIQKFQVGDGSTAAWASLIANIAEVAVRIILLTATTLVATTAGVMSIGFISLIAAGGAGYCIYNKCIADCTPLFPVKPFSGAK